MLLPIPDLRTGFLMCILLPLPMMHLQKSLTIISWQNKLVIHTAGSVSKEILKTSSDKYGVLWPMKMIRKPMNTLEPVTIVVDGNTDPVTIGNRTIRKPVLSNDYTGR
jgi:hypothetical protein